MMFHHGLPLFLKYYDGLIPWFYSVFWEKHRCLLEEVALRNMQDYFNAGMIIWVAWILF